jgi:tetratricopeptide (TPR) repeat protein
MKNILYILLFFSLTGYSQTELELIATFNELIAEGDRFVENKIDNAIQKYTKARNMAMKLQMKKKYKDLAIKKLNDANKLAAERKELLARNPVKSSDIIFPKKAVAPKPKPQSKIDTKKYDELLEEAKKVYYAHARLLIENNKFPEAKEQYLKILKYDPDNEDARFNLYRLEYKLDPSKFEQDMQAEDDIFKLLLYLNSSLENKEAALASRITKKILTLADDPIIRDAISNSYSLNTGDDHFAELFLSNPSRITELREYYIYTKYVSSKDYEKSRQYYSNLVALDKEFLKANPTDTIAREQTSTHYNNLGWYCLLGKKYEHTIEYFNTSLEYKKDNLIAAGNMPHAYLFANQFDKAKELYLALKSQPFDPSSLYSTYKDAFLGDFKEFKDAGIINANMDTIEGLLLEQ